MVGLSQVSLTTMMSRFAEATMFWNTNFFALTDWGTDYRSLMLDFSCFKHLVGVEVLIGRRRNSELMELSLCTSAIMEDARRGAA